LIKRADINLEIWAYLASRLLGSLKVIATDTDRHQLTVKHCNVHL